MSVWPANSVWLQNAETAGSWRSNRNAEKGLEKNRAQPVNTEKGTLKWHGAVGRQAGVCSGGQVISFRGDRKSHWEAVKGHGDSSCEHPPQ